MTTHQDGFASLLAYVDAILYVMSSETTASYTDLAEDTVLAALLTTTTTPSPVPFERSKR